MKIIIVLLYFCFISNLEAQIPNVFNITCITPDHEIEYVLKDVSSFCTSINTWNGIFDDNYKPLSSFPEYSLRINLIFLQRNDGTGNFNKNDPEQQNDIDELIVNTCQSAYSEMVNPNNPICYNGSDFISNSKIRFIVNKIFVKDSYGWNNRHDNRSYYMCPYESNWYLNYLVEEIYNNQSIPRGVNVYFTEDSINYSDLIDNRITNDFNGVGYACSQAPSFVNYTRSSRIHMPDLFSKYWWMKNICPIVQFPGTPWIPTIRSWYSGVGKTLAHELIHTFNIPHDYNCVYSIANPSGSGYHNYLRPTEIGRIFSALSLSNLRTFVPDDFYNPNPIYISSIENWNYEIRTYRDINVTSGGNITISCKLIVPFQSRIIVDNGGKLIISNGIILPISLPWNNGIIVSSGGYLEINSTTINDYSITVKSGGTLKIKDNLTISGNNHIDIESGGYFCIENNASIQLIDNSSLILLRPGYLNGVNPTLDLTSNCVSSPATYTTTGNGKIELFQSNVYIQNQTFTSNQYISGNNVAAGFKVTTTKPQGNVTILSGANITIDATGDILLDEGFEAQSGATFELKN